ncbi:SLC13 family permease [Auritidibacter ignavus]|uniref:SLC13 family permease n=1 Tax=Auritidibacter ignavus TaxID=678932 RepID=UPI0024B915D1|nr:SLC13 family permease [Auritidibacter ignavus]WHS34952.1 SLC13 family permease [Auritidibacter ignavus]
MTSRTPNIRYAGLLLGLGLTVLVGFLMPDELAIAARVTAAVVVLMGTWWVTEAVPLPVTAMVPLIAFPATQVFPLDEVAGSYASEIIFLLLGGFLLALGIQRWNLHRRIAILIVLVVGTKPSWMILGLMMATAALGMWVSNTATALMMIPLVREEGGGRDVGDADSGHSQFGIGLMIAIAYAATLSACDSIIASPGNIFVVGYLQETVGYQVGFLQWMLFGIPFLIVFLVLGWLIITKVLFRPEVKDLPGGLEVATSSLRN